MCQNLKLRDDSRKYDWIREVAMQFLVAEYLDIWCMCDAACMGGGMRGLVDELRERDKNQIINSVLALTENFEH